MEKCQHAPDDDIDDENSHVVSIVSLDQPSGGVHVNLQRVCLQRCDSGTWDHQGDKAPVLVGSDDKHPGSRWHVSQRVD